MGQILCYIILILFIIACVIGVVALYLSFKSWVHDEFNIELPPKTKPQESYWETVMDDVAPSYTCGNCDYESDHKYKHCPWCGMKMDNYDMEKKRSSENLGKEVRM